MKKSTREVHGKYTDKETPERIRKQNEIIRKANKPEPKCKSLMTFKKPKKALNKMIKKTFETELNGGHTKEAPTKKQFLKQIIFNEPVGEDIKKMFQTQQQKWKEELRKKLDKHKCDFNWDFSAPRGGKPKHKSYIALDEVLAILK